MDHMNQRTVFGSATTVRSEVQMSDMLVLAFTSYIMTLILVAGWCRQGVSIQSVMMKIFDCSVM